MNNMPIKPKKIELTQDISTSDEQLETRPVVNSDVDETQEIGQNQDSAQESLVKPISFSQDEQTMKKKTKKITLIICAIALVAGVGTGFGVSKLQKQADEGSQPIQQIAGDNVNVGDVFGMKDAELFKDSATGYLEAGGINGEGSHKLLRPGGESQTVYLTSTVTDLDKITGMEVKVWGETYKGQKAGWLMDVGKVEILDTEAEAPFEEEI